MSGVILTPDIEPIISDSARLGTRPEERKRECLSSLLLSLRLQTISSDEKILEQAPQKFWGPKQEFPDQCSYLNWKETKGKSINSNELYVSSRYTSDQLVSNVSGSMNCQNIVPFYQLLSSFYTFSNFQDICISTSIRTR